MRLRVDGRREIEMRVCFMLNDHDKMPYRNMSVPLGPGSSAPSVGVQCRYGY